VKSQAGISRLFYGLNASSFFFLPKLNTCDINAKLAFTYPSYISPLTGKQRLSMIFAEILTGLSRKRTEGTYSSPARPTCIPGKNREKFTALVTLWSIIRYTAIFPNN